MSALAKGKPGGQLSPSFENGFQNKLVHRLVQQSLQVGERGEEDGLGLPVHFGGIATQTAGQVVAGARGGAHDVHQVAEELHLQSRFLEFLLHGRGPQPLRGLFLCVMVYLP